MLPEDLRAIEVPTRSEPSIALLPDPSKVEPMLWQTPQFWEILGYIEDEVQASQVVNHIFVWGPCFWL